MQKRCLGGGLLLALLLTGCVSKPSRPPVVEQSLTTQPQQLVPAHHAARERSPARPPQEIPAYHVVAAGETLWSISLRYDRDYRELARINNLPADYRIHVGQHLLLEAPLITKVPPRPKPHPKVAKITPPPAAAPASSADDEPAVGMVSLTPESSEGVVSALTVPKPAPAAASSEVRLAPPVGNPIRATTGTPAPAGAFTWGWPAKGPILARFSEGALGNKGLDIGGRRGDPVLSAGDGSVVYVGTALVGYGKLIIIRHNNNYLSAYAHNDRFLVKEGQHVKLGQEIAEMGSSGADKNGLHFEIRRQGKPVDPLQYLPER